MRITRLNADALRDVAQAHGVCVRPILHEVCDTQTGQVHLIATPCGARSARKCGPCAEKARRVRMQQCREGWHLEAEPERGESEREDSSTRESPERRTRSTRRRQDVPDLPRLPIEDRTVGQAFRGRGGRLYRPSMFLTFTMPSYGRVRADGTPVDPSSYDYRRAALDALHFSKLVDRVWQNLRRAVGFKVQYFAAVEPQRRLTPHLHAAVRGAIPRAIVRQVAEATYHQVWWPRFDQPVFVDQLPTWEDSHGYVDPDTGVALPTWAEALDDLEADDDAQPSHVLRFGSQLDIQGIIATEGDADRRVGYLTKYLAKGFADAYADPDETTPRQRAHLRRLHEEVRWLPCSPRCWNWLRYGVQPLDAAPGMQPGACPARAHDVEHLGCGGRRVLVSRLWTGKTLKGHRADRAEVVRQVLSAAGFESSEIDRLSAQVRRDDGTQRFQWKIHNPGEQTLPLYRTVMSRTIAEHLRWKADYESAKLRLASANAPPRPPDNQPTSVGIRGGQG